MNRLKGFGIPLGASALVVCAFSLPLAVGGDLDPPAGSVTPTMKTLVEVEPRIAVNADNTPGDADSTFKITEPGSYYLTGNITGESGKHGIEIDSSYVTLDLMGFTLTGVSGSLDGILAHAAGRRAVTVLNGVISEWDGAGLNVAVWSGRVEKIRVSITGGSGIIVGNFGQVHASHVITCGGHGIAAGVFTIITDCTLQGATGDGIHTGSECIVDGCTVHVSNAGGVNVGYRSLVQDCIVIDSRGGPGIEVGVDSVVCQNIVRLSVGNDIVAPDSLVRCNTYGSISAVGSTMVSNHTP